MEIWMVVVGVIALALIAITVRIVVLMKAATGTTWQKFMSVFKYSGTILWARITATVGVICGIGSNAADWFGGSPMIQSAVHDVLDPKYVAWYLVVVALVTEYLRRKPVPANTPPVNVPLPPVANPPSAPSAPTVLQPAVVAAPTDG